MTSNLEGVVKEAHKIFKCVEEDNSEMLLNLYVKLLKNKFKADDENIKRIISAVSLKMEEISHERDPARGHKLKYDIILMVEHELAYFIGKEEMYNRISGDIFESINNSELKTSLYTTIGSNKFNQAYNEYLRKI